MEEQKPKWNDFDPAAAEEEMSDLLYTLVRMLKPKLVVESGCYYGHSTTELARACWENQYGRVVSCDVEEKYRQQALALIADDERLETKKLQTGFQIDPIHFPVEIRLSRAVDLPELKECDFFFCDSCYELREEEMSLVKSGCTVVVHDTSKWAYQVWGVPTKARPLYDVVRGYGGLTFEVSRGFGIFVKP